MVAERIEREIREAQERTYQRETQRRQRREKHQEQGQTRTLERVGVCAKLEKLTPLERLERICNEKSYPLDFYPKEFAQVENATIAAMAEDLRAALLERLKGRRNGVWHKLLVRMRDGSGGSRAVGVR